MIDHYFEKPYWIVDILPAQVPADSPGQYPAAEQYYLREPQITNIRRKYADLLIKLNCYYDVQVSCSDQLDGEDSWVNNPEPEDLARLLQALKPFANPAVRQQRKHAPGLPAGRVGRACILVEKEHTLAVLNADDTYMTVYNPSAGLLEMLRRLAGAEGLFVWKPRKNNLPPGELV